jgi:hypothetical protein
LAAITAVSLAATLIQAETKVVKATHLSPQLAVEQKTTLLS